MRIYNTHAPVPVEEKLLRTVRISDGSPIVAETLGLLAKDQLTENRLEVLWRAHFVDRQVRSVIESLFANNATRLVELINAELKNLSLDEVQASLRRCELRVEFPVEIEALLSDANPRPYNKRAERPVAVSGGGGATLKDLIDHGILKAPAELVRDYKGHRLSARVERDGSVTCLGRRFDSLSQSASAACATVVGKSANGDLPAANGWVFWKVTGPDGKLVLINDIRRHRR
jgi:hypothetical protein